MLATLSDVKAFLGIPGTDQDLFLTTQIEIVSDAIEAYCRRKFTLATYTQTFYADEVPLGPRIELFAFPVTQVISATSGSGTVWDGVRGNSAGYISRAGGFYSDSSLVVEYEAGFSTVPPLVKSVLYSLVQQRYNRSKSGVDLNFGNDVQRVSIPGAISIDFDYSLSNNDRSTSFGMILGSYLNVLDYYRSDRSVLGRGILEYVEVV